MLPSMPIRNLKTVTSPMRTQQQRLDALLRDTPAPNAPLADQPLAQQVNVFERIEAGNVPRATADPAFIREVEQAVEAILALLYTPLDGGPLVVPRAAWTRSPLMKLLTSVTYWLYQDDLITATDAAQLRYGTKSKAALGRIRRAMERGELRAYWRPGREHKEGRAFLVRRSEVEQLNQQEQGHESSI